MKKFLIYSLLIIGLVMLPLSRAQADVWKTTFQMLEDYNEDGLESTVSTAETNTVQTGLSAKHITSGTPANGIGVSVDFIQETSSANYETGAKISAITTDVTSTSEDFDLKFYTMAAGATAALRATLNDTGLTLTGALDVAGGDITLENDETISNSGDGIIAVDGTFDITAAGGIVLSNDETIVNTTDGTITIDGILEITAAGGIELENDETIVNSTDGTVAIDGIVEAPSLSIVNASEASGGIVLKTFTASSGTLTGATDKIEVNVPSGCLLVGVQLRVDVTVSDDAGDDTWSAEWNDGASLQAIAAGAAAAQNTKVNTWHNDNANTPVTDAETDIVLTPNGGNFDAGEITAVVYYYQFTALDDAS